MRYILSLILLVILISCKKEKEPIPGLIKYDSEIFSGSDMLIYGNWTYLFTHSEVGHDRWDTVRGINVPDLNFQPIGNYKFFIGNQIIESGKIDTMHFLIRIDTMNFINMLGIRFCRNGIKSSSEGPPTFRFFEFLGSDTLLYPYALVGIKEIIQNYYLRIK